MAILLPKISTIHFNLIRSTSQNYRNWMLLFNRFMDWVYSQKRVWIPNLVQILILLMFNSLSELIRSHKKATRKEFYFIYSFWKKIFHLLGFLKKRKSKNPPKILLFIPKKYQNQSQQNFWLRTCRKNNERNKEDSNTLIRKLIQFTRIF